MSFFKAAFAVAAVAGVAFAGYKLAKKHPTTTRAIVNAMATVATASSNNSSRTIHVKETETVIKADKENLGGVMGVAARAKEMGTTVRVKNTGHGTSVVVDRPVVELLKPMDYADAEKRFGGLDK